MTTLIGAAILFSIGFAGGYVVRQGMSMVRRSKLRKTRVERSADQINALGAHRA